MLKGERVDRAQHGRGEIQRKCYEGKHPREAKRKVKKDSARRL